MRVYHNNRDGTFTQVNRELGLTGCWGTMSGSFGDFNNDGYLDLVLGNGSPKLDRLDPLVLLESDGKKFRNTTFAAGLPFTGKSHGVNLADLFGEAGSPSIVAAGGAYPGDLLTTSVYCPNDSSRQLPQCSAGRREEQPVGDRRAGFARSWRQDSVPRGFRRKQFRLHAAGAAFRFGRNRAAVEAVEIRWPSGLETAVRRTCRSTRLSSLPKVRLRGKMFTQSRPHQRTP